MRALRGILGLVLLGLVVAGAVLLGVNLGSDSSPGEGSADVGFTRDMRTHHGQAVEMAELLRDRTEDEELQILAADVALGQQGQMGQMRGWLDTWGLEPTSTAPPMVWAHGSGPDTGTMPGLASDDEVARLAESSGDAAEVLFLQLMIRHHQGGVHMAGIAEDLVEESQVRTLARSIGESQLAEITYLKELLAERGGTPLREPATPGATVAPASEGGMAEWWREWGLVVAGGVALAMLVGALIRMATVARRIAPEPKPVATVASAPDEHRDSADDDEDDADEGRDDERDNEPDDPDDPDAGREEARRKARDRFGLDFPELDNL